LGDTKKDYTGWDMGVGHIHGVAALTGFFVIRKCMGVLTGPKKTGHKYNM